MSDLKEKTLDQTTNPGLKYKSVSRRTFLKGALAVGGALALAGCRTTDVKDPDAPFEQKPPKGDEKPKPDEVDPIEEWPHPGEEIPFKVDPIDEPTPGTLLRDYGSRRTVQSQKIDYTAARAIVHTPEKCSGCRRCMIVCAMKHNTADTSKALIQISSYPKQGGRVDFPVTCFRCGAQSGAATATNSRDTAPCIAACPLSVETPSGTTFTSLHTRLRPIVRIVANNGIDRWTTSLTGAAVNRNAMGTLVIFNDRCLGGTGRCTYQCIDACIEQGNGCITKTVDGKITGICDQCDGIPECYINCMSGAFSIVNGPASGSSPQNNQPYAPGHALYDPTPGAVQKRYNVLTPRSLAERAAFRTYGLAVDPEIDKLWTYENNPPE
ncbi:MAG: twin-arginine translocation signal domain-containing protein [Clostridiales bacterium]|nr:twin-arginine translocation signal domain-containing protein [Clostridiales bacterium]